MLRIATSTRVLARALFCVCAVLAAGRMPAFAQAGPTLTLLPETLPDALFDTPYSVTFTLDGAAGAATFTLSGRLPPGLTLANGVLSGSPRERNYFDLTVTGTEVATGRSASQRFALVVNPNGRAPTIASIWPESGHGDTPVTIRGTNFNASTEVRFDGYYAPSVTIVDSTTITALAPAPRRGYRTVHLSVNNPDGQWEFLFNAFSYRSYDERIAIGLGPYTGPSGRISVRRGADSHYSESMWALVPWPRYAESGGGFRVAVGDVDGDGLSEIVAGLGTGSNGWIAVLDDAAHGHALMRWVQVSWPAYNAANGEVWPAVGDIDGDRAAEIVVGLGQGGGGWFQIFDDANTAFAPLAWRRVDWSHYNAGHGTTHPAIANLDGVGPAEIVLGLGHGSGGWLEVVSGATEGFRHRSWIQVQWPSYNAANGTTFPAGGDLDGDGRGEIVVGLGRGSGGWLQVIDDASTSYAYVRWMRLTWRNYYERSSGETHPAIGNIDNDPLPEVVVGLDEMPGDGGWVELLDDERASHRSIGFQNVGWAPARTAGSATFPAIGRFR